jgi:hypothetical protein
VDVLENEEGLSVVAVTIHVHCLLQRRDFRAHHLITAEALAAIAATLPEGGEADRRPDGKGLYSVTLPRAMHDRLTRCLTGLKACAPGESYSDVIIRVARGGGVPLPRHQNYRNLMMSIVP